MSFLIWSVASAPWNAAGADTFTPDPDSKSSAVPPEEDVAAPTATPLILADPAHPEVSNVPALLVPTFSARSSDFTR